MQSNIAVVWKFITPVTFFNGTSEYIRAYGILRSMLVSLESMHIAMIIDTLLPPRHPSSSSP